MSIFVNREGNISVFRVGIFLLVVGLIVAIGGYILFTLEQNRFKSPLNIELYSGAVERGIDTRTPTERVVIYQIANASVEEVKDFYELEIADFYGVDPDNVEAMLGRPNDERCNRQPALNTFEDYVEGSGNVQYYFSCMFNESQYDSNRWTEVRIMPGILNVVDGVEVENTLGLTRVEYHQWWER